MPPDAKIEKNFRPAKYGSRARRASRRWNLQTGKFKHVVSVPFQVGHIQTNRLDAGRDRLLLGNRRQIAAANVDREERRHAACGRYFPKSEPDWVTHEAVISKDEVAFAIMGHRKIPGGTKDVGEATAVGGANPGQEPEWGPSGTRERPTGLGIVNLRTREMRDCRPNAGGQRPVARQRFARRAICGRRRFFPKHLSDRPSYQRDDTALRPATNRPPQDHPHPTMSPDGTKIQIQSAMLSEDGRSMNICIIPVPEAWLKRKY